MASNCRKQKLVCREEKKHVQLLTQEREREREGEGEREERYLCLYTVVSIEFIYA
jgi:hypothetical protein